MTQNACPSTPNPPQTTGSQVIIYAIHLTQYPPLPVPVLGPPVGPSARAAGAAPGAGPGGGRAGAFLGEPRELVCVEVAAKEAALLPHSAAATAIGGDARCVVVGFEDGCLAALSWSAKVRACAGVLLVCAHLAVRLL